jgi:hypothetical protein
MSYVLAVNGVNYTLPSQSERNWATQVNTFFTALANTTLQKAGGSFSLTAEVDFGYTYGVLLGYIKSRPQDPNTYPIATAGFLRLNKIDQINWKNNAGTANIITGLSSTDKLQIGTPQSFMAVASTDVFYSWGSVPESGAVVQFTSFTGTGITLGAYYYAHTISGDTFKLYTTAGGPTVLDVLTDGTGTMLIRDDIVTKSSTDTLRNKTFRDIGLDFEVSTISAGVLITTSGKAFQRITSSTPTSLLKEIGAPTSGKMYYFNNATGSDITVEHNTGTATQTIYTPGGIKFLWKTNTVLSLVYDSGLSAWIFAAGSSSGGYQIQPVASGFTAIAGTHYLTNTSTASISATLPAGYSGAIVLFSDASETWDTNNLTVTPASGEKIDNLATNESLVCDVKRGWVELSWNTALSSWSMRSINSIEYNAQQGSYRAVTAAYTLTLSDYFVSASGASNYAVTLPSAVAVGAGRIFVIKSNMNTGVLLNISTTSSQTIDGVDPGVTPRTIARFESLQLMSNGSGWEIF